MARAVEVFDARTDIFAFGVVVHEMITGRKTFYGKSRVLLMSAIVTAEPALVVGPARVVTAPDQRGEDLPGQGSRRPLADCAARPPGGVAVDCRGGTGAPARTWSSWSRSSGTRVAGRQLLLLRSCSAAVVTVGPLFSAPSRQPRPRADPNPNPADAPSRPSPPSTARRLPSRLTGAYCACGQGRWASILVSMLQRPLGSVTLRVPEPKTLQLFWSPDSRSIAARRRRAEEGRSHRGRAPRTTATRCPWWAAIGAATAPSSSASASGLFRVSAQGGRPGDGHVAAASETGHYWPHFPPDGRRFYLGLVGVFGDRAIFMVYLDSKKTKVIATESKQHAPGVTRFRESAAYVQSFDGGR